jgi:hypothetical protein
VFVLHGRSSGACGSFNWNSTDVLIFFRCENKGRDPHILDKAQDNASRDPSQERGENDSPDHDFTGGLVAGEADGVARIVGGVVRHRQMRQADGENQRGTHKSANEAR